MPDQRKRLISALSGRPEPALPVICPGGMMSMVCHDVTQNSLPVWLEAHQKAEAMAKVAIDLQKATGFENYGLPFCMTVEAEALGATVDFGNLDIEPRIKNYILEAPRNLDDLRKIDIRNQVRIPVVLNAIRLIRAQNTRIPIIGAITGPVSLATSLIDADKFLRLVIKDKAFAHELIDIATETAATFAELQVAAGADVVSIGDPTASGEIIGPQFFEEYVIPALKTIIRRSQLAGGKVILHICGNTETILEQMGEAGADAISFDAVMAIKKVRTKLGDKVLMGNLSTFLMAQGTPEDVARSTRRVIEEGIDIVSPACGLSTGTPSANALAMTTTVRYIRGEKD